MAERAEKILDTKSDQVTFNLEELNQLLDESNDRFVTVVSFIGPKKSGKTYLANYWFESLMDRDGFGNEGERPLDSYFPFNKGVYRASRGVHLSRPIELPDSPDKAVFIMDCQGYDDNPFDFFYTAVALVVSSTVVLNVLHNDEIKDKIEDAIALMERVLDSDCKANRLLIVVRDCPAKIMKPNELIDREQLDKLNKLFVTVSPVIMREIGDKARSPDFDGAFNKLSNKFKASMRNFFSGHLIANELGDYSKTCAQLVPLIENLVELFNRSKTPSLQDIQQNAQSGHDRGQLNHIKKTYKNSLARLINENQQLDQDKLKVEGGKMIEKICQEQIISNQVENELVQILDDSIHQLGQSSKQSLISISQNIMKEFDEYVDHLANVDGDKASMMLEQKKLEMIQKVDALSRSVDEQSRDNVTLKIKLQFMESEKKLMYNLKNKIHKVMKDIESEYRQSLSDQFDNLLDETDFDRFEHQLKQRLVKKFSRTLEDRNIDDEGQSLDFLEVRLNRQQSTIKSSFISMVIEEKDKTRSFLSKLKREFELDLNSNCTGSEAEMDKYSNLAKKATLNRISELRDIRSADRCKAELDNELSEIYSAYKKEKMSEELESQAHIDLKVDKLKDKYRKGFDDFLEEYDFEVSDADLKRFNRQLKTKIKQEFDKFVADTDLTYFKRLNQLTEAMDYMFEDVKDELDTRRNDAIAKELINDYMEEYRTAMSQEVTDLDQLDSLHIETADRVVKEFNKSRVSPGVDKKSHRVVMTKEMDRLFADIRNKFETETKQSSEINGCMSGLIAEMHEFLLQALKNNQAYSEETFTNITDNQIGKCVLGMEKFCKESDNSIKFNEISKVLLVRLEEKSVFFKSMNVDNRRRLDDLIDKEIINCAEQYSAEVDEELGLMTSDDKIDELHNRIKLRCRKGFSNCFRFVDTNLEEKALGQLSDKLDSLVDVVRTRAVKLVIAKTVDHYRKEFKAANERGDIQGEHELMEFHKNLQRLSSNKFRRDVFGNFNIDINDHMSALIRAIEIEFDNVRISSEMSTTLMMKSLETEMDKAVRRYHSQVSSSFENVDNDIELTELHQNLVRQMTNEFGQLRLASGEVTQVHKNILKSKMNALFNNVIMSEFSEVKNKQDNQDKLIKLQIQTKYRELMRRYMGDQLQMDTKTLEVNHERACRQLRQSKVDEIYSDEKLETLLKEAVDACYKKLRDETYMNFSSHDAVGVDLGTTNTCIAIYKNSKAQVICNELGNATTPSMVAFVDDDEVIGDPAKERFFARPELTVHSVKRVIGRKFTDTSIAKFKDFLSYNLVADKKNQTIIKLRDKEELMYPESISAMILAEMKKVASRKLNCDVTKAVITVPAYFDSTQIQMTKKAAEEAEFIVLEIMKEPIAAAFAYKMNLSDSMGARNVVIFDFGGGTFDVAVLSVDQGTINVEAYDGDQNLGGDDIDRLIIKYCVKKFQSDNGIERIVRDTHYDRNINRLRERCEAGKCQLSDKLFTEIKLECFYQDKDLDITITREMFEQIIDKTITKAFLILDNCLSRSGLAKDKISDIVLVGGTTRIPIIRNMLEHKFPNCDLNVYYHPDEAVALGAAVRAAILNGEQADKMHKFELKDKSLDKLSKIDLSDSDEDMNNYM